MNKANYDQTMVRYVISYFEFKKGLIDQVNEKMYF